MGEECPTCHGLGVQEVREGFFAPCLECSLDGRYIPFTSHGMAVLTRFWVKDCMVVVLTVGGVRLDQVRVGWN